MSTHTTLRSVGIFSARALGLALVTGVASAHPGHEVSSNMFLSGLIHPLTGFDHLFAMLAVGLWSALAHKNLRQAAWTPVSFLCLLLAGAFMGIAGLRLPAVEPIITASVLVLGLLVASRLSLPTWAGAALVGFFAIFHGMAHGSELPESGSALAFVAGFMLTTFSLHVAGLAAGFSLKQHNVWLTRLAGGAIALYGVSLASALA
ncbi:HupE/UreJ family protein [Paralcaligenes sp. KSB-10]|uniref:HupE/UreJ family protein n=1 Tax=Paralcaligenes sp. KSB-10 TaxID=2901142 RepID=UPI001E5C3963|nr:HupE/UreJ family protein [Paralcaligenes sp. KSB-10]UHL63550.1 HupE/UreJ family protein [Paralcaligenes sp. KSB-10]